MGRRREQRQPRDVGGRYMLADTHRSSSPQDYPWGWEGSKGYLMGSQITSCETNLVVGQSQQGFSNQESLL